MKIIETLVHSDSMSGRYVLDDGSHVHWSEGRVSEIDLILPSGQRKRLPQNDPLCKASRGVAYIE